MAVSTTSMPSMRTLCSKASGPGEDFDAFRKEAIAHLVQALLIADHHGVRLELEGLLHQQIAVVTTGEQLHGEALGLFAHDLQGLRADGAGGTEDGDLFHAGGRPECSCDMSALGPNEAQRSRFLRMIGKKMVGSRYGSARFPLRFGKRVDEGSRFAHHGLIAHQGHRALSTR